MPLKVSWYNAEETIIFYEFSGRWTWEECYRENEIGKQMVRGVPHTVYVLAVTTDKLSATHIPANTLTHLPNITKMMPDNSGLAVIVSNNNLWLSLDKMLAKVSSAYANRVRFAPSVDVAMTLFKEHAVKHNNTSFMIPS